jgi:hypothetical protein
LIISAPKENSHKIPFDIYGTWMTQVSEIPLDQVKAQLNASSPHCPTTSGLSSSRV